MVPVAAYILATVAAGTSVASPIDDFTLRHACALYGSSGTATQATVELTFQDQKLKRFSVVDGNVRASENYDGRSADAPEVVSILWAMPDGKEDWRQGQHSRIYMLDYSNLRFGYSTMTVTQMFEPRPNVPTSKIVIATGICKSVQEKNPQ